MKTKDDLKVKERAQQVVVAFDFSASAEAALDHAMELARAPGARVVHVICAIHPYTGVAAVPHRGQIDHVYAEKVRTALEARVRRSLDEVAPAVRDFAHTRIGNAANAILALAKSVGADLIVIGSHGFTGVDRWLLGSTSELVVRRAGCPVHVARPKTYEPVELTAVADKEHPHPYVPPHRYAYEETRVVERPSDWPLF